jgi:two-component system nitrate/nitrite response regulator NarL
MKINEFAIAPDSMSDDDVMIEAPSPAREVLIVEDDPAFIRSLSNAVHKLPHHWVPRCFETARDALMYVQSDRGQLELALVDLGLPDMSGIEVVRELRSRFADIPILVVSVISAERSVLAAIRAGARGYILKDDPETSVLLAMQEALQGNYPISPALARYLFRLAGSETPSADIPALTPKELELLQHMAKGCSYTEAARRMHISVSTVQTHIRNLYRKLDVHSQVQAVTKAQDRGII